MTDPGETDVCQLPTHADIVRPAGAPALVVRPGSVPDAIVVPASRPAHNLETAIDTAKAAGCQLVILCSFRTDPADLWKLLDDKSLTTATVVEVPENYDRSLFDFETTRWAKEGAGKRVCAVRNSDLSIKRNIGLVLARMLGWNSIFFMDDDIGEVDADAVIGTVALLGTASPCGNLYRSAGMRVKDFPDNSVVCHARRQIGEYQDVFVSGSVLAVDTSAPFDFFPDIYNEDWLFFYRDVATERLARSEFKARQLPYDPFANPLRAAGQEFGDVIAEGLYALLHSKLGIEYAGEDYWHMFLGGRNRILDDILQRLQNAPTIIGNEIGAAIMAAHETLQEITPDMCAQYIQDWRRDLEWWGKQLATLPVPGSMEKALRELRLPLIEPR